MIEPNHQPIIIAGPPRSGSTLVAALYHSHGVHIGRSKPTPYPKTNTLLGTENIDIKQELKKIRKRQGYQNWNPNLPDPLPLKEEKEIEEFQTKVLAAVRGGEEPWLIKTAWTVIYWRLFYTCFPNAKWVLLPRNVEEGVDSVMRHPVMKKRGWHTAKSFLSVLRDRQAQMLRQLPPKNVLVFRTSTLMKGYAIPGAFEDLMHFANIEPIPELAEEVIDPTMWHGK